MYMEYRINLSRPVLHIVTQDVIFQMRIYRKIGCWKYLECIFEDMGYFTCRISGFESMITDKHLSNHDHNLTFWNGV